MADPKHLVRTSALKPEDAVRIRHPLNPNSDVHLHSLGDRVGMQRCQLHLARLPPGKESFIAHAHGLQEEFVYILEGEGRATTWAFRPTAWRIICATMARATSST